MLVKKKKKNAPLAVRLIIPRIRPMIFGLADRVRARCRLDNNCAGNNIIFLNRPLCNDILLYNITYYYIIGICYGCSAVNIL